MKSRKILLKEIYKNNKILFFVGMILSILNVGFSLLLSYLIQTIINLATGTSLKPLYELIYELLIIFVIYIIVSFLIAFFKPIYVQKGVRQFKNYIFSKLLNKSIYKFKKDGASVYISSLTNDIKVIEENYISNFFEFVTYILLFIGALVMMLYYNYILTIVGIVSSLLPFLVAIIYGGKLERSEKEVSESNEKFLHFTKDTLSGFSVLKSFKAENRIMSLFKKENEKLEETKKVRSHKKEKLEAWSSILSCFSQMVVFIFGAYLAISGKGMTAGTIMMFVQLMNYVTTPLILIPQLLATRRSALPLVDKIGKLLLEDETKEGNKEKVELNKKITLNDVNFSYGENQVINNINYCFEMNKSYAVVGGSGSGKTTLFQLIMGIYDNYNGSILYDDKNLKDLDLESLYDVVSIVEQNVFIFDDTILNNITMYQNFDSAVLDNVIKKSGLSKLVCEKGLDYYCGENGSNLSGGEKQRISIARGLLKNYRLLLMDEATSALDNETSMNIVDEVLLIPNLLKIIITHNLNEKLLEKFDEIIVLKEGKIVEKGSFNDLMKENNIFASLYKVSQK